MEDSEAQRMRQGREDIFFLLVEDGVPFYEAVALAIHYIPEVF